MSQTNGQRKKVYDKLYHELSRDIDKGNLSPGEFVGTESELAERAGIARMSARVAIGRLVAEGKLFRRPGRGVFVREQDKMTRKIQVLLPELLSNRCVRILHGVQEVARMKGVQVQVYDAHYNVSQDAEILRQLPGSIFDGAVVVSLHHHDFLQALFEVKSEGFPCVLVDQDGQELGIPSVLVDNYAGGYEVGKRLIGLGHKRIGFIGTSSASSKTRLEGLRDAVNDAGYPIGRKWIVNLDIEGILNTIRESDQNAKITQATLDLIKMPERPTAIFYACDILAGVSYRAIRSAGLRIPEDLSIVGFDDESFCELLDPPLTTIAQPSEEMGARAMELLLEELVKRETQKTSSQPATKTILPPNWIDRDSAVPLTI